jgi:ABC-type molybdate transport system substrate-binding protein
MLQKQALVATITLYSAGSLIADMAEVAEDFSKQKNTNCSFNRQ